MTVFLGSKGRIELKRTFSGNEITTTISDNEVVAAKKRFSLDTISQGDISELITGDQIEIRADSNLVFLGLTKKTAKYFINVDQLGGIRLYETFTNAVTGGATNAISLTAQSAGWSLSIRITVLNAIYRIVGQVTDYELNTNREVVDISALGDDFRNQYSGILSGSGRISCIWDYKDGVGSGTYETSQYLHQLILRSEVGSGFLGHFYLKIGGYNPSGGGTTNDDVIWYEVTGVLTNVATALSLDNFVKTTADFVTTGPIVLKAATEAEYQLLQENDDDLLLEQDSTANLDIDY